MLRFTAVLLRFSFAAGLAAVGQTAHSQPAGLQPFVVTEPMAVQAAEALFQEVQSLANLVTPCVSAGKGTPIECACRFATQLGKVQRSARAIQSRFPDWQSKVINWTEPVSKQSRAISLEAVLRQSSLRCPAR